MTTLSDIRARLRLDLHDVEAQRWADDQLDRHIERALGEVSFAAPREETATVATTPGSRDLSLGELEGLVQVEAVEHPAGLFPASYVRFSTWGESLTLHAATPPKGEDVKLYYTARHLLDEEGSTLAPALEDLVATGAAAYAALELANAAIDAINLGGREVPMDYAAWGRAAMTAFRQLLHEHSRRNAVRARRLYVPAN